MKRENRDISRLRGHLEIYDEKVIESFAGRNPMAEGCEAINSLYITNAIYLSSWEQRKVQISEPVTDYELEFEREFKEKLKYRYI